MRVDGLDRFLQDRDFPGVVVLRRGDQTLFEGAYGLASPRWGAPNELGTRFDCASVTKLFTAVAVLRLVGRGLLDLDASIHEYADLAGTTISPAVTLRQLLTHSSGIADDVDEDAGEVYADLWVDRPCYAVVDTRGFLSQFASKPALFAPGAARRYCNCGFVLAGLAVERATGLSYREYVVGEVFGPAGMDRSGFFDRRDPEPDVAEGFDPDPSGRLVANIFKYPPIGSPDGGAHVTAGDLHRFVRAARDGTLLTAELTAALFTCQLPFGDGEGQGFALEFHDGDWWKEGYNAGASGMLKHYATAGVDAAVLSNTQDGTWPVVAELDRLARDGRGTPG